MIKALGIVGLLQDEFGEEGKEKKSEEGGTGDHFESEGATWTRVGSRCNLPAEFLAPSAAFKTHLARPDRG